MKFAGLEEWKSKVIKNINSKINRLENESTKNKILGYGILNVLLFFSIRVPVLLVEILLYCIGIKMPAFPNFNEFDLLLAQISNTFIVLSLTSVLSTSMGTIYWVDIKEEKLVSPVLTCFYALTVYLLTSMVISACAYVFRDNCGSCISFLMSVLCLIILTYSMIDAYFNRERLKKKYRWEYCWTLTLTGYLEIYNLLGLHMLLNEGMIVNYKNCKKNFNMIEKIEIDIEYKSQCEEEESIVRGSWQWNSYEALKNRLHTQDSIRRIQEKYSKISMALYGKTVWAINEIDFDVIYENIELMVLAMDKVTLKNVMNYSLEHNVCIAVNILFFLKEYIHRMTKIGVSNIVYYEKDDFNWLNELIKSYVERTIGACSYRDITYKQFSDILDYLEYDAYEVSNFRKLNKIFLEYASKRKETYIERMIEDPFYESTEPIPLKDLTAEDIKILNSSVEECENSTLSYFQYKPIKELYFIYLKKDILLMEYCIRCLKSQYELILEDYQQSLQVLDLERTYKFRFISEENEEYLNLIFRREEIDPILPPKMIQDLKDLIYIEL